MSGWLISKFFPAFHLTLTLVRFPDPSHACGLGCQFLPDREGFPLN